MSENKNDIRLFENFPPVSNEEWKDKIMQDLKGADYERKLVWRTLEGFNVSPYYRADDLEKVKHLDSLPGEFPYVRGKRIKDNSWFIRQDLSVCDYKEVNNKALDVLMKGVDSLGFLFKDDKQMSEQDFELLLKDICISSIETNFEGVHLSHFVLEKIIAKVKSEKLNVQNIKGSVDFDPIGRLTLRGNFCESQEYSMKRSKEIVELAQDLPNFQSLMVHGNYFHNSGSSIVQELAFSLAVGTEYLSQLTQLGLSVDEIAPKLKFKFSVGSNYFMEIAKLRAAKMLWAKIVESFEPCCKQKGKMQIHCESSKWNLTVYDSYVNMLRTTTETMSAALGAADSITVIPFNDAYETATDFSKRIAQNTQIILKEEAYFDKIVDPSAGSYYIENLTDSIANGAWKLFQQVEEKGGYIEAFKQAFIQTEIEEIASKRDLNIATKKEVLLGTNQFPNFSEKINIELTDAILNPQSLKIENAIVEPLKMYRGAQAFEALRYRTEKSGRTIKTFMLTSGNLAMRKARASFACNFFACAGFEVIDNFGFKNAEEGVKAAKKAKADIVVICSSDDEYANLVPEVFELIGKDAIVAVAGYPKNILDDLKAKGITNFIHVKSNILETLQAFQKELGI